MTDIIESNSSSTNEEVTQTTPVVETQTTETKLEPKSMREVIAESFDKLEQVDTDKPVEKKTALPKQDNAVAETAAVDTTKEVDPISGRTLEPIKAPAGMPAGIREKWGTLDRQVQQYWTDREKDIQQTLSKTDNERKLASEFKEIAAPYEGMLRQFNVTAGQHAKELFNLSYSLNNGTPQTKAQIIFNLINHFKPDPQSLQQLFAGQPVQQTNVQQPINVQDEVNKVIAARTEAEEGTRVQNSLETFKNDPANEFFSDVRGLMGKIIDAGLVTGNTYDEMFKNAYELACQRTPDIKNILDSRGNASVAQGNTSASVQKAKAVPSVKPSLNGGSHSKVPVKPMTARQAAEMAYDNMMAKK
jgi:hypothetical protein